MAGSWSSRSCALGHTRLSILDLSDSARQPMVSEDGQTALVFNGEIYNFREIRQGLKQNGCRFRTTSDTEALLYLYPEKGLSTPAALNGMFSFAVWDERKKRLFAARDRLGKKPFYYWQAGRRFGFSSELASLIKYAEVPRELNHQAMLEYLLYDFIPAPHTIFKGVRKLPAGHMLVFDPDGLKVTKYWDLPDQPGLWDYPDARAKLEELLEDAVRIRLVSDVPLGAFLSGGVDSTLVAALMTRIAGERVKTFSISFPETSHDESRWSRLAAESLGTDHCEYPVRYEIESLFPLVVERFGEPFGDSSAIPTWRLCERTRRSVTVALSGDGGDELFGGYDRYLARRLQIAYDFLPRYLRERVIEPIIERLPATTDYYGASLSKKLKLFACAARRVRDNPLATIPRTFSAAEVEALTGLRYDASADPVIAAARQWVGFDPVTRMLCSDLQTYLAEDILTKVDRMSMAHALEVRCPLLDHRIVELAAGLPLDFKLKGFRSKRILKDVALPRIPKAIVNRSKYGFQAPLGAWLKGELRSWAAERLLDGDAPFFRREMVERMWLEHIRGEADHAHKVWLLLVFNEWFRQLKDG
jgi:asparagine synthase (glutamine-hydrolysing)